MCRDPGSMSRAVVSPAGRRRIFARGFHSMKIAFLASAKAPAQQALSELMQRHGQSDLSRPTMWSLSVAMARRPAAAIAGGTQHNAAPP